RKKRRQIEHKVTDSTCPNDQYSRHAGLSSTRANPRQARVQATVSLIFTANPLKIFGVFCGGVSWIHLKLATRLYTPTTALESSKRSPIVWLPVSSSDFTF